MHNQWSDFGINRPAHSWEPALARSMTTIVRLRALRASNQPNSTEALVTRGIIPSLSIELVTRVSFKSVHPIFWYSFEELTFDQKSFEPGFVFSFFFLIFIAHFAWACVCTYLSFILSITLVCLISPSFPIVILWNLLQSFIYVYPTRQPIYSFKLLSVKSSQYLLHYMLDFAVTYTKI